MCIHNYDAICADIRELILSVGYVECDGLGS